MDYKQESLYGAWDASHNKMPFYMAYPIQTVYMEELEYARDMQKLKDMYSKEVREIQELVEDECDKMEYDGSLMFDETPDQLMLRQITDRIYDAVSGKSMNIRDFESEQYEETMQAEELPLEGSMVEERGQKINLQRPGRPPHRPGMRPPRDRGLEDLIQVLLFNEMHQRRCRHKRCRRWW